MNLLERIKKLAKDRDVSIYQLEEEINIGRNTIYQWNKRTPSSDKLEAVANYFNVSVDYLLGRTEKKKYYELSNKEKKDIAIQAEELIDGDQNRRSFFLSWVSLNLQEFLLVFSYVIQ